MQHLIQQLKKNGITDIVIAISYLGEKIKEYFGDGSKFGVNIQYSEEQDSLLTGGALAVLQKSLKNDTFLVIHGDVLTDLPFSEFIQFHKSQGTVATLALSTSNKPAEFGQIKLQGAKIKKLYQYSGGGKTKSHLIHTGIYAFEPQIFDYFPKKKKFALEDIISILIEKQEASGFVFEGKWFDVGDPKNYEKAIKEYHPQDQK